MKRSDIVQEARKCIDYPFLHQGRNEFGIDCVGVVIRVGEHFNIPYEDLQGYARAPVDPKFLRHLRKYLNPAPINGSKVGMVGVFRQSIYPCHVGIFASDEKTGVVTLINSRVDRRRVVEEPYVGIALQEFKLIELLGYPGLED